MRDAKIESQIKFVTNKNSDLYFVPELELFLNGINTKY